MKLPLSKIAEFIGANTESRQSDPNAIATGYSIDSRTILPGELFFAVKGEKMNGHDFVHAALERGAVGAVVSRARLADVTGHLETGKHVPDSSAKLIAVEDTLVALQTLATSVRRLWGRPIIAVTGSAGKTTTKEAIAYVLATRMRVHKSEGNFNNHFGLPLMLLKVQPEHDIAVVELGMSHLGEIKALAQIAQPEAGVVTNVAPVHLEFFDSIAGIARAKYELVQSLPGGGTAVLNADDQYVSQFGREFKGKVVTYGLSPTATVRAENIQARGENGSTFDVVIGNQRQSAALPLVGSHNVYNALAAIAVAIERGLTLADAADALKSLTPAEKRGQVVRLGNISVVNDCYNSNPKALAAMVDALASMPAKRRIVVAGEMLELGPEGKRMHEDVGRHIAEKKIDFVIGVRGLAENIVTAGREGGVSGEFFATPEEAGEWLSRETSDGDVVLLKASRGVKLEKALTRWQELSAQRQGTRPS